MIIGQICNWAHVRPGRQALAHNGRGLSYAVFVRAIDAARRFLERSALSPRGTAVVILSGSADTWPFVLALRSLGLDTLCAESVSAALDIGVRDVSCIVSTKPLQANSQLEANAFPDAQRIVVAPDVFRGVREGPLPNASDYAGRCGSHILYSSGTTGKSKMIVWNGEHELARLDRIARHRGLDEKTAWYAGHFPLWTGLGFNAPLAVWLKGGSVILEQRPDWAERFFNLEMTQLILSPYLIDVLIDARRKAPGPVKNFLLTAGAGFLPAGKAQDVVDLLTRRFENHYAATELPMIARSQEGDIANFSWLMPEDDRRVEVIRDSGEECADGEEGEIRVALLECDANGYLGDEDATRRHFRDGYFYPGDLAVRREDGRIRILGRSGDVINMQGFKVAVGPLEEKVQTVLRAQTVCLFSGQNSAGQDELTVAIESDKRPPEAALARIKAMFPRFDNVRFEILEKFPRSESELGKVKRAELRKLIS